MNESKFKEYAATLSGVSPVVIEALNDALDHIPPDEADLYLSDMLEAKVPLQGALGFLRSKAVDIKSVIAAMRAGMGQSTPLPLPGAAPAAVSKPQSALEQAREILWRQNQEDAARAASAPKPPAAQAAAVKTDPAAPVKKAGFPGLPGIGKKSADGAQAAKPGDKAKVGFSLKSLPKNAKIGIAVGVVVLVILVVVGFFFAMQDTTAGVGYVPNGTEPAPTATAVPTDGAGNPTYWFTVDSQKLDATEPFMWKPVSISDFFKHLPWRWLLWVLFFIPMMVLLSQDRFAASERTDLQSVIMGMLFLFGGLLLAEPIAWLIHWLSVMIERPTEVAPWIVMLLGIFVNLTSQWSATSSGKKDYSAFAIAGLFITGATIVWWFPNDIVAIVLGVGLMALGICLQGYEMGRSKQGGRAIMVSLVMITFFGIGMGLWLLITWAITGAPRPESVLAQKVVGLLLWGIISSRLWVGGLIGLAVAYFLGDMASSVLMPPTAPGSSIDRNPDREVRSNRTDNQSRFDAMVFGIMILYPISFVVWEVARLFGAM